MLKPLEGSELDRVKEFLLKCFDFDTVSQVLKEWVFARSGFGNAVLMIEEGLFKQIASAGVSSASLVAGRIAGWLVGREFIPSPWLFEVVYEVSNSVACCVDVVEQGVKAFLYGNDVLVASVRRVYEPFCVGSYVAVRDASDLAIIGVGRVAMDSRGIERAKSMGKLLEVAVLNVFDLGLLLRSERSLLWFQPAKLKPSHR